MRIEIRNQLINFDRITIFFPRKHQIVFLDSFMYDSKYKEDFTNEYTIDFDCGANAQIEYERIVGLLTTNK